MSVTLAAATCLSEFASSAHKKPFLQPQRLTDSGHLSLVSGPNEHNALDAG